MLRRVPFLAWVIVAAVILAVFGWLARSWAESRWPDQSSGITQIAGDFIFDGQNPDDLAVMARNIGLLAGGIVGGDAALVGSTINVESSVTGDLTMIGETVTLAGGAQVGGDMAISGSNVLVQGNVLGDLLVTADKLMIAPEAVIAGEIFPCVSPDRMNVGDRVLAACNEAQQANLFASVDSAISAGSGSDHTADRVLGAVLLGGFLSALSALGVVLMPDRLDQIEHAVRERGQDCFGAFAAALCVMLGITALVVLLLAVFTPLGLAVLPVALILGVGFIGLGLIGLAGASLRIGQAVTARLAPRQPPVISALVGGAALGLMFVVAAFVPPLAVIAVVALGFIAATRIGGAILTRAGSRSFRRSYFVQG